jgi:hypothetical protein
MTTHLPQNDPSREETNVHSEDERLNVIGPLAVNLHMNHAEELDCELPTESCAPLNRTQTADYLIEDNRVRFNSIEARNHIVALYEFKKNRTGCATDIERWLQKAHELWACEIGKKDSAAGRLLALVHKTDDIFVIASNAIERGSDVFNILSIVEAGLTYIDEIPANSIIKLCTTQHERTKNDLFSSNLFGEFQKWFMRHRDTAHTVHELLRDRIAEATANLYPAAIIAIGNTSPNDAANLALEDALSPNFLLKSNAIWTLGRLLAGALVPPDRTGPVEALLLSSLSSMDEIVRQTAIRTTAKTISVMDTFREPLTKLAEAGNQDALNAIAEVLFMQMSEMHDKPAFNDWLQLLCNLSSASGIRYFDHILRRLITIETRQQMGISCFTECIRLHAKDTPRDESLCQMFAGTIHEIGKHSLLFSEMITDWFLSDSGQLANAAAQLLAYLEIRGVKTPIFSKSRLDVLEQRDLLFLARRLAGFILSENHLISLTMSFLETNAAPQRTFAIVYSLLVDEVGQDYPFSVIDTLKAQMSEDVTLDAERRGFYSRVSEAINGRLNALANLRRLTDLKPSPKLQRQFAKARARQMRDATEEAQKGSILRQLVTHIPIKAGVGFFTFRDGGYADTCHMQSFSHSIAVPRRDTLDTVGYEIHRLLLRNVTREES